MEAPLIGRAVASGPRRSESLTTFRTMGADPTSPSTSILFETSE